MSETWSIEERLRRFVAAPDDADWQDVLRRSGTTARCRPRITPRRLVVAVVVVVALVLATVSIAGGSLFGFSNHGKRVPPPPSIRQALDDQTLTRLGWSFRLDTFKRLALRHGIGVYTARTKKGDHLCYLKVQGQHFPSWDCAPWAGQFLFPQRIAGAVNPSKKEQIVWMKTHHFPSPARPLIDMSELFAVNGRQSGQLVGLAADGVRSIQLLALSDCHPIATVPVINNVYIEVHTPKVVPAFLVARNAGGKVIWHSAKIYMTAPQVRAPLDQKLPRNCGLR